MSAPSSIARAGAGSRLLRAAVFTAVCVVLSALGHVLAACATVPWWTLLLGFAGVFALTAPFAGRERSLPVITTALAVGQLALHAVFGLGQRHLGMNAGQATDDALIRMATKLVCGAGAASLTPADASRIIADSGLDPATATATATGGHEHLVPAARAAESASLFPSLSMVLGHLLAALATGWLLRRGDLALGRLATLSGQGATEIAEGALVRALRSALSYLRALLAGLPGTPATGPRPPRPRRDVSPPPLAGALQHTVIRRGPPAVCVLAA
ncbi:hypothetical protein [Streptomyces purpureus]|uniref:hypothetical protein n=1 Tax=Streptomyces purpureus TaxID=1951 RepID=UPI00166FEABE|nr:hypothetical protein [Streptomyces purpureus]